MGELLELSGLAGKSKKRKKQMSGELLELSGGGVKMARKKARKKTTTTRRRTSRKKRTVTAPVSGCDACGLGDYACVPMSGEGLIAEGLGQANARKFVQDLLKTARRLKRQKKFGGAWLWANRALVNAQKFGLSDLEEKARKLIDSLFAG